MHWRHWRVGLALVVAVSLSLGVWDETRATQEPTLVMGGDGRRTGPRPDGTTVVWTEHHEHDGRRESDIYGARLADRQVFPIATDPGDQATPDIDHGVVVWQEPKPGCLGCERDIRGMDLATGEEFVVTATAADETRPTISGSWVVWVSYDGITTMLKVRDLSTMAEPITLATGPVRQGPIVSRDRVVWEKGEDYDWQLYSLRVGGARPAVVADGVSNSPGGSYGFDLAGDTLVYVDSLWTLVALNLASGQRATIPGQPYDQAPTTDGRYVVWQHPVTGTGGRRHDLLAYDLATDSLFVVTADTGYNSAPALEGGVLVWQRDFREIHATRITDALPSARHPDPGTTSRDWLYFPETGHYLSFGFKGFWEQSGGLPVFGYPLTEEFTEQDLTVQYLERQRFEYHPAHAGTPYEVQLGRLGAEDAAKRGLLNDAAFQPLPADTPSDGNCTFFPETGHRLCFGFKAYWQAHGLEFGDPGVSYRESLALFGYPISEESVDPETGLVTQYFERARFEYHPANPEPHKVLLGRLGADLIAERDW